LPDGDCAIATELVAASITAALIVPMIHSFSGDRSWHPFDLFDAAAK
jgi:hypothetical protein